MAEQADKPDKPSVLHRPFSNRAMEILLVVVLVLLVIVVVFNPITWRHSPIAAHAVRDMSNLRTVVMVMHAYASDNEDQFPLHLNLAEDYFDDEDIFISRFDDESAIVYDDAIKPGWYTYGSYRFISAEGLSLDADNAAEIMLAYRTPRDDHAYYVVGFLDGHAEILDSEAFQSLMSQQDELLPPIGDRPNEGDTVQP